MSIFKKLKRETELESFEKEKTERKKQPKKKISKHIKITEESPMPEKQTEKKEENDDLFGAEGELAVDVYQTDQDIVIQTAVAGVRPEDIDISIEDDVITIRGERKEIISEEKKNYYFQECYWGVFARQIILPEEVDVNKIEASFQNNVLILRMPKLSRKKTRKIKIEN